MRMIIDESSQFIDRLAIATPPDWIEKLRTFHTLLSAANAQHNLTRITDFDDYLFKHVADSLLATRVYPSLRDTELSVADVGCGAGFPGLPLAMAFPRLSVNEIDSATKKIWCVERFIEELGLSRCQTILGRARELSRSEDYHHAFDLVLARAVGDTPTLIRECRGLLKPERSALVVYKTPRSLAEEKKRVERESAKAHLEAQESEIFSLPGQRGKRQFWILSRGATVSPTGPQRSSLEHRLLGEDQQRSPD